MDLSKSSHLPHTEKPGAHLLDGTGGFSLLILLQKGADLDEENDRAVIGYF